MLKTFSQHFMSHIDFVSENWIASHPTNNNKMRCDTIEAAQTRMASCKIEQEQVLSGKRIISKII